MATFKPARSLEECQKLLTAPGSLLELDTVVINGRKTTVWKNLWPNLRAYWMLYGKTWSAREYVVFENERYTYGQMFEKSSKLASMLREVYGVRKGDRVAIMMRNFPEYMLCFWAACLLGAVPTLLNSLLPIKPTKYCIRLTDPKILILDPERAETLASHIPSLSSRLTTFVIRDHELHPPNKSIRGIVSLQKALEKYDGPLDAWQLEPECTPEDDAALYFTSGTTGLPKGVLESQRGVLSNTFDSIYHTFRAFLRRGEAIPVPSPTDEQKVHLLGVPLFHVTGLTSLAVGITFQGTKLVLVRKWDPEQVGRLIVEEGIHATTGVPSTLLDVLDSAPIKSGKKTKLEYLGGGGAAFPSMLAPEAVRRLPGSTVTQGYGLTETNAIAVSFSGEDFVARPSSTGLPPPVTEIKIVTTDTGKKLPAGEIGEILIRGAKLMKGYWNDPGESFPRSRSIEDLTQAAEATRKAITKDGWFKSGDLGYV
ncbi:acetyl-CoA synthetase-like protein, partial [Sistotremastrum niveocremeum HHB9708]